MTKLIAVFGRKKSGKTTIIETFTRRLSAQGLTVGVAKHVHHADFTIDIPGKDSWRFTEAGARCVYIFSPNELVIIDKSRSWLRREKILSLVDDSSLDVIFLEGFYHLLAKDPNVYKVIVGCTLEDIEELYGGCNEPLLFAVTLTGFSETAARKLPIKMLHLERDVEEAIKVIMALVKGGH